MNDLGLENNLIITPSNSLAARNRYVYYPDHLVRMPHPSFSMWENAGTVAQEPLFKGALWHFLLEVFQRKPGTSTDESVGNFIRRHYGSAMADNVASAIFHGIYAGDIDKLSVRSILPKLWHVEQRYGSILRGLVRSQSQSLEIVPIHDTKYLTPGKFSSRPMSGQLEAARNSSVFTFKDGIGSLIRRLEEKLQRNSNVKIRKQTSLLGLDMTDEGRNSQVRRCHKRLRNQNQHMTFDLSANP